jgi:hypothetical protein
LACALAPGLDGDSRGHGDLHLGTEEADEAGPQPTDALAEEEDVSDKIEVEERWSRETVGQRPGTRHHPCDGCGQPFKQGSNKHPSTEVLIVHEIRSSCFRGEDEIEFYHEKCAPVTWMEWKQDSAKKRAARPAPPEEEAG